MRRLCMILLASVLALAGCSGMNAPNAPAYEVSDRQEGVQGGFAIGSFTVSTAATSEEDLRLVSEAISSENPSFDALAFQFFGENEQSEPTGGGQYFASREAAEALLGSGYTESDVDTIMNEGGGYLIVSMSDTMEDMCADADPETRSIMECPE